jgi:hypothetical protein
MVVPFRVPFHAENDVAATFSIECDSVCFRLFLFGLDISWFDMSTGS